jgi:carboxylesterase
MIHSRRRTLLTQKLRNAEAPHEFRAEGRAPAVLGFHGFTGTASELRPLVDRIAAEGYAVHVPLMPGHGARADVLQDTTFDAWAAAMRAHAESFAAQHGKIVMLAFSMGTLVAMHIAAEKPPWLAGLVVMGNALELHPYASLPFSIVDRFGFTVPDWYFVKVRHADMSDREAAKKITAYDRHPLRAAFEVYRAGRRVREEVARIACPTLVLHGARDLVCRPRAAKWLASNIGAKDVTLSFFAKSGHVIAADLERDHVAREVLAFIARI